MLIHAQSTTFIIALISTGISIYSLCWKTSRHVTEAGNPFLVVLQINIFLEEEYVRKRYPSIEHLLVFLPRPINFTDDLRVHKKFKGLCNYVFANDSWLILMVILQFNLKEVLQEQRLHSKREIWNILRSLGYSSLISDPYTIW